MKSVSLVITLYVERTLMLNGSFIVHSFRRSPFTIMEANDAKSPLRLTITRANDTPRK